MKKTLKRLGALALALCLVLALSSVAFAAEVVNNGSVYQDDSLTIPTAATSDAPKTLIPMTKSIIMFNLNGSNVYEPNISYTYSVAPVTAAAELGTITDDGELNGNVPVTVKVNAGVVDGVSFVGAANTIAFSSANAIVTTEANGVKVEKSTNLTVDASKFPHAGVYRYKITEGDNAAAVAAVGMVRDTTNYSRERYLDVYISNVNVGTEETPNWQLQLTGAVIFKTNATNTDTPAVAATTGIDTTTEKTTGFEPGIPGNEGEDVDYTTDTLADHYTTYDFTVKKVITGNLADKTHDFPFFVNVTNTIANAKYTFTADNGTATAETITGTTIVKGTDTAASTIALKDGESISFVGVPSNQTNVLTIAVKEFNNTYDAYTASAAVTKGTVPTVTMDTANQMSPTSGYATLSAFDLKTNDVEAQIITVTNNLAEISPTGVVLRFAPYALMLCAGVVLLVLSRRRKMADDEA